MTTITASLGLDQLSTETIAPGQVGCDTWSVERLAQAMNATDQTVPLAVERALPQITPAIEATVARLLRGGRLIYVGAGTPGRLAVLDASECPPTFSTPPDLVFALIAGGPQALVQAVEGAEDDRAAGRADIDTVAVTPADTVLGLTASGRTPYVVAAIERARERGALTVGLSCNAAAELSTMAEYPIEVLVGPEFIAGSTRLKAGTAQKLVLNMFSTIAMIRLGKTYDGYMVDLWATNAKLRDRARRIVAELAAIDLDQADQVLAASGQRVKPAIVMAARDLDLAQAEAFLAHSGGNLRAALEKN